MAIKIVVSNTVKFKVRGTLKDEAGVDQPFDFSLTCLRLTQEQIDARLRDNAEAPIVDFLADVVEDWSGVRDEDDKAVPYDEAALRTLCKNVAGVSRLAFHTYLSEVGAKAKN